MKVKVYDTKTGEGRWVASANAREMLAQEDGRYSASPIDGKPEPRREPEAPRPAKRGGPAVHIMDQLVAAIAEMVESPSPNEWSENGAPKVDALRTRIDAQVTSEQRNAAWAKYREQNPTPDAAARVAQGAAGG